VITEQVEVLLAGSARHLDDRDGRGDRARDVGLFRYALIRQAADPAVSSRVRGRLVSELAAGSTLARSATPCGCPG